MYVDGQVARSSILGMAKLRGPGGRAGGSHVSELDYHLTRHGIRSYIRRRRRIRRSSNRGLNWGLYNTTRRCLIPHKEINHPESSVQYNLSIVN